MKSNLFIAGIIFLMAGCMAQTKTMEVLPMQDNIATESIDMRGKTITPFILYHASKALDRMQVGEILEIVTDNFEAIENDIRAWCRMRGHRLLDLVTRESYQKYAIAKADQKQTAQKMAMVISDPALDKLVAPLGLALGAALSGAEVDIYFQGPAVRLLKRDYRATLKGYQKPFSPLARSGMAKVGHLPPEEKLLQLKELGVRFYLCGGSMEPFGVKKADLVFDDVMIAEYFTFLEVMQGADLQIYLQ